MIDQSFLTKMNSPYDESISLNSFSTQEWENDSDCIRRFDSQVEENNNLNRQRITGKNHIYKRGKYYVL